MALSVGSLFSGIGGIDLGLERAGMVTRWFCEIDPHCRNVLARYWPDVPIHGDIAAIDWSGIEPVDVLAGGFPCQPVSAAGHGRAQADPRWLWPAFRDAIRALRPRYVLVENVRNLLAVNGGTAFAEVLGDLAAGGFDAEWDCIPASAVGARHQRDRLWLVAYPSCDQLRDEHRGSGGQGRQDPTLAGDDGAPRSVAHAAGPAFGSRPKEARPLRGPHVNEQEPVAGNGSRPVAHTDGGRLRSRGERLPERQPHIVEGGPLSNAHGERLEGVFARWSAAGPADRSGDGRDSGWWAAEPDVGRVAHGIPHRVDRLRSLGNAVVPQVVEPIGRALIAFDEAVEGSGAERRAVSDGKAR